MLVSEMGLIMTTWNSGAADAVHLLCQLFFIAAAGWVPTSKTSKEKHAIERQR